MLTLRTCSLRRYRIQGALPAPGSEELSRRLTDRRFLPLSAREERTYGWVTADNLLLTRFDADTLLRGEQIVLGLRIDRRRVNPRLLRAQLDLETRARALATEDGAGPKRMSKDERQELRQHLAQELLKQTSPTVDAYTVILDPARKQVNLLTLSRRAHETLSALFLDTFEASLVPLTPWRRAQELLDRPQALDALERTEFWSSEAWSSEAWSSEAWSTESAEPRALQTDRRLPS